MLQNNNGGSEEHRVGDPVNDEETVKVADIQNLLTRLPGVLAARLLVSPRGDIEAIHVLATTERGARQVLRDVESTLSARWGISIDQRKISIARIEAESEVSESRLELAGVSVNIDTVLSRCHVVVTLRQTSNDGTDFIGKASGVANTLEQPRIVASATLDALSQVVSPHCRFACEDARTIDISGRQLVVVVFTFLGPGDNWQLLSGSSPILGDPVRAVINACLQGADPIIKNRTWLKPDRIEDNDDIFTGDYWEGE